MEMLCIITLSAVLIVREYQSYMERRELLDRIMCADYREFKRSERKPVEPNNVNMTDADLKKAEIDLQK